MLLPGSCWFSFPPSHELSVVYHQLSIPLPRLFTALQYPRVVKLHLPVVFEFNPKKLLRWSSMKCSKAGTTWDFWPSLSSVCWLWMRAIVSADTIYHFQQTCQIKSDDLLNMNGQKDLWTFFGHVCGLEGAFHYINDLLTPDTTSSWARKHGWPGFHRCYQSASRMSDNSRIPPCTPNIESAKGNFEKHQRNENGKEWSGTDQVQLQVASKTIRSAKTDWWIKNRSNGWFCMHSPKEWSNTETNSNSHKQFQADRNRSKEFLRQCPVCMCAPPCSGFQPNVHCVGDASLATHDLELKLGLISGDFMKNTEMSPATKSNCELQPESERRLHQFQDSLLPSAWVSCQWPFHCHECIELGKEMKWHSIS